MGHNSEPSGQQLFPGSQAVLQKLLLIIEIFFLIIAFCFTIGFSSKN